MEDVEISPQELSEEIKELLPYLRKIKDFEIELGYNIASTVNLTWGLLFLFAGVLDYLLTINEVRPDFVWAGVVIIGFFLQSMIGRQNLLYERKSATNQGKPWSDFIIIGSTLLIAALLFQPSNNDIVPSIIWLTNGILAVWKRENDLYGGWGCITDNFQRNIIGVGSFLVAGTSAFITIAVSSLSDITGFVSGIIAFLTFLLVYLFNRNKQLNVSINN